MSYTLAMKALFKKEGSSALACKRCLVVTRIDSVASYLTVADTGSYLKSLPFSLPVRGLSIGVLLRKDETGSEVFELCSAPPENLQLESKFIPATGAIILSGTGTNTTLCGELCSKLPSCENDSAAHSSNWSFSATYQKWDGELYTDRVNKGPFYA